MICNERLLHYFRERPCDWCGRPGPSEAAHIYARGIGGGSRIDAFLNLVSLCRSCHDGHHLRQTPSKQQLWEVVAKREGLESWEVCRDAVHKLLRI